MLLTKIKIRILIYLVLNFSNVGPGMNYPNAQAKAKQSYNFIQQWCGNDMNVKSKLLREI
jgi:hypothetical protein